MFKSTANRGLAIMVGVTALALPVYFFAVSAGTSPVFLALIAFAVAAAITYACVPWWRSVDEAVREAHKSAWFFGGMLACLPLLPALILIANNPEFLERLAAEGPSYKLFAGGVLITLLFQLTGYVIAWATWWLRRR